jgi:CRISPR-associated endonuclease Cas1
MKLGLGALGRMLGAPEPARRAPAAEDTGPDPPDAETWPLAREAFPVHVVAEHAAVRLEGGRLSIAIDGGAPTTVRLDDVSALLVHGNTSVSTPALLGLMRRGVPVLWHGFDGRLVGQTLGLAGPGTALREAQYAAARDGARTLSLARAFIAAKIANARRLVLRRAGAGDAAAAPLARAIPSLARARTLDELRGVEGAAADAYFRAWPRMIEAGRPHLRFTGRSRRPPGDPANAALSYLYAVLHGRCVAAAVAAGLDPMAGFLHARRPGRAALALDLMEPFRPLIVDAALIAAFNNGEFPPTAFERAPEPEGGWRLNAEGRRAALRAFERRLAQGPGGGAGGGPRRHAYRDAVTAQARDLARALREGEPFTAFEPRR